MARRYKKRSRDYPDNEFDEVFTVSGQEIFYIDDQEIEVEDAVHAIKDGQEYIIFNDQLYPVDRTDNRTVINNNYNRNTRQNTGSSIKIAVICLILGIIVGGGVYFILLPMLQHTDYTENYHWIYGGHSYSYTIQIPKSLYDDYRQRPHDNISYTKYALTQKDKKILDQILSDFREHSDSKTEAAHNVVAFVQSLPYFKDDVSTGHDDYARYPIETLVDRGGDCEDTAILTAALLKEMGYDVIIVDLPGHVAVGITCSGCKGFSYPYEGKMYYYLETTGNNWKVGQIPPQYKTVRARLLPM
jgi:hypothetical protein